VGKSILSISVRETKSMIRTKKLLAGASCIVISAFGTAAYAAGTTSGSTISNTATVNYTVGGVGQPSISNTPNTFVVDRKIVFRVDETAPVATTTVAPGQTAAVTTFTVSNISNATMDFGLSLTQQVGGAGAHSNTDNFDVTAPIMYADTNGNGTYEPATDTTVLTFLDEVLADTSRTVFVVANIPAGRATGDVAAVTLTGQARDGGVAGQGAVSVNNNTTANTAGVDTVFADTAYDALNTAADGFGVAKDDYTVSAAALTVTKVNRVIEDPINTIASGNAANAKMIPGATIEYCIIVANAAGGGTATGVSVTDPVPATLSIIAASLRVNGTATAGVCNANGVAGGSVAGQNVSSGTLNNVAAGANVTVYFQATIN
jgi:uncharacterized repeat protein (TIGR01451 family)